MESEVASGRPSFRARPSIKLNLKPPSFHSRKMELAFDFSVLLSFSLFSSLNFLQHLRDPTLCSCPRSEYSLLLYAFPTLRLRSCWHLGPGCPPTTSLSSLSSKAQLKCHLLQEVLVDCLSVIRPFPSFCMTCVSTIVPTFILPCVVAFCFGLLSPVK